MGDHWLGFAFYFGALASFIASEKWNRKWPLSRNYFDEFALFWMALMFGFCWDAYSTLAVSLCVKTLKIQAEAAQQLACFVSGVWVYIVACILSRKIAVFIIEITGSVSKTSQHGVSK